MIRMSDIAVGLAALSLSACAARPISLAPSATMQSQQPHNRFAVGEKRWLNSLSRIQIYKGPPDPGEFFGKPPGVPVLHGGLTIEGAINRRIRTWYLVRLDDGRQGWVEETQLLLSDNREEHARAEAEKATCKRKGGVAVGMTRQQVLASCWGKPRTINRTTTGAGSEEQFVYPGFNYVYLDNGIVTSVQTSASR